MLLDRLIHAEASFKAFLDGVLLALFHFIKSFGLVRGHGYLLSVCQGTIVGHGLTLGLACLTVIALFVGLLVVSKTIHLLISARRIL